MNPYPLHLASVRGLGARDTDFEGRLIVNATREQRAAAELLTRIADFQLQTQRVIEIANETIAEANDIGTPEARSLAMDSVRIANSVLVSWGVLLDDLRRAVGQAANQGAIEITEVPQYMRPGERMTGVSRVGQLASLRAIPLLLIVALAIVVFGAFAFGLLTAYSPRVADAINRVTEHRERMRQIRDVYNRRQRGETVPDPVLPPLPPIDPNKSDPLDKITNIGGMLLIGGALVLAAKFFGSRK